MTDVVLFLFDQKFCRTLLQLKPAECRIEGLWRTIKIKLLNEEDLSWCLFGLLLNVITARRMP